MALTCIQGINIISYYKYSLFVWFINENFQLISLILISLFLAFINLTKPNASVFLGMGSIPHFVIFDYY